MDENGRKCAKMSNTLCRLEIDPGRGGTHSADRKSTRDVAEHTLPTRNQSRLGGTHSGDRISIREVAEQTLPAGN